MPKVTVLMSVYNGELYLREAIESILAQTYRDFELLIVNDGSTDSSREIILSFNDPRIRLLDNECNLGLTRSLNKGWKLAQGEFIARQDADDISEPERLAKQVICLEKNPDVVLVGTWHREMDAQGNLLGEWELPRTWTQIRWSLLYFTPFVHSSVMLRQSAIVKQIGFYNEDLSYSQDYELWFRIASLMPVVSLDERLVRTRINPNSMTATYGEKALEGFRMRSATVGHLLAREKNNPGDNEQRLNRMTELLFNFSYNSNIDSVNFTLEEVNEIIEEILNLQVAFCQNYNLAPIECLNHRKEVLNNISDRLMDLARRHLEKDNYLGWQLLVMVSRLNKPVLFTKKYIRLASTLIISRLVDKIVKN